MFKYRRILSFLTDTLFICILTMLITASIANPARFDYEDYTEAYTKKMESINLVIGSEDVLNEYENQIGQELYDYIKVKGYEYMYFIIFTVLYFAVFAYFNNGKTLGCVLYNLQIVNKETKKANIFSLGIRSIFMGTSFMAYFPIQAVLYLIIPRVLDVHGSFLPLLLSTSITAVIELVLLLYFIFNKKDMALYDYICNTKIIDTKK